MIDVARNAGREVLVKQDIRGSELDEALRTFTLRFTIKEPSRVEYRVWVSGDMAVTIDFAPAHRAK